MNQKLYNQLLQHFDNVIEKKNKIWVLAYGDLYVIKFKNNTFKVYRNWTNPFLLSVIALLDWLTLEFVVWAGKLNLNSTIKFYLWLLLFAVSILLTARNNTTQKKIIRKIIKIVQTNLNNQFKPQQKT